MSNSVNNSCFWNVLFYLLRLEHASHLSPGQIQRIFCHERPTTPYLWDNNLKCSRLKHEGLMTHDYLLINDKYLDHLRKDDLWTALRRRHSRMTIIFFLKWRTPPPRPPRPTTTRQCVLYSNKSQGNMSTSPSRTNWRRSSHAGSGPDTEPAENSECVSRENKRRN